MQHECIYVHVPVCMSTHSHAVGVSMWTHVCRCVQKPEQVSSSVTTAQPGPGDEAVPLMHWLDFGVLGGLQPKLCSEKPKLQDSNSTVGPGAAWPGLAWPGWWGFKPNATSLLLCCLLFLWKSQGPSRSVCRGLGSEQWLMWLWWLMSLGAWWGTHGQKVPWSQGVTGNFTSFPGAPAALLAPRPPRTVTELWR